VVTYQLGQAVRAVVRDCLDVSSGEEVLVICNPATQGLGERLRTEAEEAGADAVLAAMTERRSHTAEPPAPLAAAMTAAEVILAPTVQSLSHTAARVLRPTVTVDGTGVVREGEFVLDA
jgi:aminopeptidase